MTDCQEIQDLLPWHVNHTLSSEEDALVSAHLESGCDECQSVLEETRVLLRAASEHPAIDDLLDVADGAPAAPELGRHLGGCPDCREALALASLSPVETDSDDESPTPVDQSETRLRVWRVAAVVAALSFALGWLVSNQESASIPGSAQVATLQLLPDATVRSTAEASTRASVPEGALVVTLYSDLVQGESPLHLEVVGPSGDLPVASSVRLDEEGAMTLLLTAEQIVPGEYTLSIHETSEGPALEVYRFRLVAADG